MPLHDVGSPTERGEISLTGRCQICGAQGPVVAVVDAPLPNQFCERCAVEYGEQLVEPDEGGA